jgi:hypothetical protein
MLRCTTYHDDRRRRHRIVIIILLLTVFAEVLAFSFGVASVTELSVVTGAFIGAAVTAGCFAVKTFFRLFLLLFGTTAVSQG